MNTLSGIRIVVIGNGNSSMAKALRNELKLSIRIYCDRELRVYKCLNTRRGNPLNSSHN